MIDRDTLIRKVMSRLEDADYDIVANFVKSNESNVEKIKKYFDSFNKRNNLTWKEKKELLMRLQEKGVDLKNPELKETYNFFGNLDS